MSDKLNEYINKRDFTKTSEPEGKTKASKEGLRFVVQHHMARAEHYDFRLEWEGTMLSWAIPKGPSFTTRDKRLAVRVEDHPLDYRNFEGTIPQGEYGGGTVMIWDEGFWQPLTDVAEGLSKGELKFTLKGKRLKGNWALIKWKAKSDEKRDNWLLFKEKDEYVQEDAGIAQFDTSIRTGRTMSEIEENKDSTVSKNPFDQAEAQLAKLVDKMPEGKDWVYEVKYDGYRILAFVENHSVRLMTRNHHDYLSRFSSIGSVLTEFAAGRSMVLDGEVVVLDKSGKSDFQSLQNYLKGSGNKKLTYIIFDILALDGVDLRNHSLTERKEILESLMEDAPTGLHFSKHIEGDDEIFKAACQADLEGIIGKKVNSTYTGSRDGNWIKIKCDSRQEFVIGGYTLTGKKADGVSALLLGVYEDEKLVYVGRAGTGMSNDDMSMLEKKFNKLTSDKSYFDNPPKKRSKEKITWLKPDVVAEIKFAEWTGDNLLRQASYQGIRTDKEAKEVKREKVEEDALPIPEISKKEEIKRTNNSVIEGIKITHPDKILYESPEITKLDVAAYYEEVAKAMLPYIENRILSVVRCPKGISEPCFFLKHSSSSSKHITEIQIDESSGEKDDYFYLDDEAGIIYEVQMGTLEFHTWGSNIKQLEKPDIMVFDLDPDAGMDISSIRQGARDIKGILEELSLTSYLKTSGGKGYHVVVPIKPSVSWDAFHDFARGVAEVMEARWPDRYTGNVRKDKRKGKIFVDWLRNGRGATSIAPYSIRARKGAKVSMPIAWDELDLIAPDDITMEDAIARIDKEDPWKGFFQNNQMLK